MKAERAVAFDNAAAYDQYMARWSRLAGAPFLAWLAPAPDARWLEIGCGTGAFSALVVSSAAPRVLTAIDASAEQVAAARIANVTDATEFQVGDAQALPFPTASFDVIVSALTINFLPDRRKAVSEMRRVGRAGATIAGYVWDFEGERSPSSLLRSALRLAGVEMAPPSGSADSTLEGLAALFEAGGLAHIATKAIDVTCTFSSFDELWRLQTPSFHRASKKLAALHEA